ncbi:MAG: DUF4124 domain-containing protein [Gammaproteobacteria bacterium]|nr:DUF4124 domain-containing protein [Gammaproteobacteria bacterium]NIM72032.1 DUF4124 domain-containing protein [Gammaproteobacteria bacterium]NIN38440.1 DUF4124 domain-containing protein [Gammaproteobacteria bacterium]NIO23759.1 DUF4124 domain-containing protein [Gammaproteobacteria bacterium]NIO64401.1 DUF4124 domain-containing protein [Gammaproteobacteria bacterium]
MKRLVVLLFLALAAGLAHAQGVYKITRPDGSVEFTDAPPPDSAAEKVQLAPLNTTPPLVSPGDAVDSTPVSAPEQGYSEFRIKSPESGTAVRENAGNVAVNLSLKPPLRPGDTIDLLLDGKSAARGRSTAITLTNLDRGAHSIQAVIADSAGTVVARSNTVTVTLQRRSALLQPPRSGVR